MSWHIQEPTIDAYTSGHVDDAVAFSVEAHLLACEGCRATISTRADVARHERVWTHIREEIERPREPAAERLLGAIGVRNDLARLIAATPTLRGSWVAAVALALVFAVIASHAAGGDPLPFLALAPLAPLAGVAAAFGRPADPVWELGLSTPTGGFALMLIRSTAVLAVSVVLAGLAALALPNAGWEAAAWLLPALGLTVVTLAAASTRLSARSAAGVVSGAWLAIVVVTDRLSDRPLAAFGPGAQLAFAALTVAGALILLARHAAVERPTRI
jgi:hypothetical protein